MFLSAVEQQRATHHNTYINYTLTATKHSNEYVNVILWLKKIDMTYVMFQFWASINQKRKERI